jgi:ComF family protein
LRVQTLGVGAGGPPGFTHSAGPNRAESGGAERSRAETGWRAISRVLRSPSSGIRRIQNLAQTVLDDLFTTALPADCRACDAPLLRASAIPVCDACFDGIEQHSTASHRRTLCARCGEALASSPGQLDLEDLRFASFFRDGVLCTPCRAVPPAFARAVSVAEYRDQTRTLLHLLKYHHIHPIAGQLGPYLARAIYALRPEAASSLLVIAVPLFSARQRQRGTNQSVLLATAALRTLAAAAPNWILTPGHHLLQRTRATSDQYTLSPHARRRNLKGAFAVTDKAAIKGREILLIDDIYTTGATARECSRVLLRAGASKVWVATFARAQAANLPAPEDEFRADTAAWDHTQPGPSTTFVSPTEPAAHHRRM